MPHSATTVTRRPTPAAIRIASRDIRTGDDGQAGLSRFLQDFHACLTMLTCLMKT